MKQRLIESFAASLEWRAIAFLITGIFLWFMTGTFWQATVLAIELHILLLLGHFAWYYFRETRKHSPKS